MRFVETKIAGVWVLEPERFEDDRGFFACTWLKSELSARGLATEIVQQNVSHNRAKGTLRGMHYQAPPHEETKVVSCIRGAIHDVVLDLRRGSRTFLEWVAVRLDAGEPRSLYIPKGCAHGYQTLEDDVMVLYSVDETYHAASTRGVLWNDPAFAIEWPLPVTAISERDRGHPPFAVGSPRA